MDTTISAAPTTPNAAVRVDTRPFAARLVTALLLTAAPLAALLIWLLVLQGADVSHISDLGLITAMPPTAFIGPLILLASFAIAINQPKLSVPILLLHVVVLIVMLFGAAIVIEGQPRTAIAWKLVGIIDHVMYTGSVDANRDAFQNWPGFFILVAFFSRLLGIESPLVLAAWAHVFFNLLYLGPLLLLMRTATRDQRLTWLGVWFFYICNWIGQDYLAPQALGYFFYLLILAVLLTWFMGGADSATRVQGYLRFLPARLRYKVSAWLAREPTAPRLTGAGVRKTALLMVLLTFMVVMVPSHQLTPVALLAALMILVVAGRISPNSLPLFLGVLIVAYISFLTLPYLRGHISVFTQPFGDLTSNVNDNVTARVRGSVLHSYVVLFRIFSSLVIWLIAGVGAIQRLRRGYYDISFLLLATVPFGLLALQTYGGELLLRTFLFSLPFAAFFMASVFFPRPETLLSPLKGVLLFGMTAALVVSFFVTRYGNERMDYFTDTEVGAMEYVYANSGPGTHVVSGTESLPWRYKEYNTDRYSSIERAVRTNNLDAAIEMMSLPQFEQSFLVLTRSQQAAAELFLGWQPGAWEAFAKNVAESGRFRLVYSAVDAQVYVLVD